jgi:hypothetical protein
MKRLSKLVFTCVLLSMSASKANAALTYFVANPALSQISGDMSVDGQINVSVTFVGSDSSAVSGAGTLTGPVSGTVDANVDTSGATFGFQGMALSSSTSGSLSPSATLLGVPVSADISVTHVTVGLTSPSSLSSLTYTGTGNIYSWGPTDMTLDINSDYTVALSVYGSLISTISDTNTSSMSLTGATGTVTLDALGKPIEYTLGIPNDLVIPLSISATSGLATGDFTGNLTLNNVSLDLQGSSTVVPVPAAVYLFGSGLLGLIGIARRRAAK